jgi:hypothetical protein
MVLRLAEPLTRESLELAAQSSLAPTVQAAVPGAWAGCWVVADPPAWDGGRWQPGLRAVSLRLVNAGPVGTEVTSVSVDGDWVSAPSWPGVLTLPGYGDPVALTLPLNPAGLEPGRLTGTIRVGGPGWALAVPLQLFVPFGSQPWWDEPSATLATHVQDHVVRLSTGPAAPPAAGARGGVFFQGAPVAATEPYFQDGRWHWDLPLTAGEYGCTLLVDGKAVELQAEPPHRWAWEHAGRGRLTVGAARATATVRNIGDQAVDAYVETDEPWLAAEPQRVQLEPGGEARLTLLDRLTHLADGAPTAHVRLLTAADRRTWAELPVERRVSADRGLPVVSPGEITLKAVGARVDEAQLTLRNVGGEPLAVKLEPPDGLLASPCEALVAPGGSAQFTLKPGDPARLGGTSPTTGFLVIQTDPGYPALRRLQVPFTVRRLTVEVQPAEADLGPVAPGGHRYQPLKLRRSDGAPGRFRVTIPPEAEEWLAYRSDQLVARHRGPAAGGLVLSGPVATLVTVTELITGAEARVPVRALLQRPRLKHSGTVEIANARAGRQITRIIRIWDEGEGLQIRDVRTLHHWLSASKIAEGVEVTIATGLRERVLNGEVQILTNDPLQPTVGIPVKVSVKLTWWERLRARGLGWVVPAGAAVILAAAGLGAWWWVRHQVPFTPPADAVTQQEGGNSSHGHVDFAP